MPAPAKPRVVGGVNEARAMLQQKRGGGLGLKKWDEAEDPEPEWAGEAW